MTKTLKTDQYDHNYKQRFLSQLIRHSIQNDYRPSWVTTMFSKRFGHMPDLKGLVWYMSDTISQDVAEFCEQSSNEYKMKMLLQLKNERS